MSAKIINIALIDDESMEREIIIRMVRKANDACSAAMELRLCWHALTVEQAIELADNLPPDLIILDNSIPPMHSINESLPALAAAGVCGEVLVVSNIEIETDVTQLIHHNLVPIASIEKRNLNAARLLSFLRIDMA